MAKWVLAAVAAFVGAAVAAAALGPAAQSLFDFALGVGDGRWDAAYKLVAYAEDGAWSTRMTAWHAAGLLRRAAGSDVADAKAAIANVLACQLVDNPAAAWFGTFKLSPDEPALTPTSALYPPSAYGTYDPNWREFIGTELIQIVEEFSSLIGPDLVSAIEDALELAAIGSMRRNGTNGDNLTLAYSNPSIMRALTTSWIGARRGNSTFIDFGKKASNDILALFKQGGQNILGEYNTPAYYGVDIWALGASIKYGRSSTLISMAEYILPRLWDDIANHFNPYLGNLVGPYDRAYSRDITQYSSVLSMFFWGIFGRENTPQPPKYELNLLYDIAQGASLALIMDTVASYMSSNATSALSAKGPWNGSRSISKTIYSKLGSTDAASTSVRNATSWISSPLMIGGQQLSETGQRGDQFVPAIVHWAADPTHTPYPYVGFFLLYPSTTAISAVATDSRLDISYPDKTLPGANIFTFALSNIPPAFTLGGQHFISGFEDLPCLDVNVTAPGLVKQAVTYGSRLRNHYYYNISYAVPTNFAGIPRITLDIKYTCSGGGSATATRTTSAASPVIAPALAAVVALLAVSI